METMNGSWIDGLATVQARGEAAVLLTLLGGAGSTPRDAGSKMLVTLDETWDTLGGGQLEFTVVTQARACLAAGLTDASPTLQHFPLGAALGQCCGGSTSVLFEPLPGRRWHIAVFGAGHVARHLIPMLGQLPCQIRWIDSRDDPFPSPIPANVTLVAAGSPEAELSALRPGSDVVILTHDHALDYALCQIALRREDLRFIGMIGSRTKAARFQQRLQRDGLSAEALQRLVCPIGLPGMTGKLPGEIALAIAAQLLQVDQEARPPSSSKGLSWNTLRKHLGEHGFVQQGLALKPASQLQHDRIPGYGEDD
ncbi:MAG: xanthine dehydrogenase accessory protein XdhC [Hahellaceae bacterium]|nr:xanthine dehydrogenase accessory protein XdhC [Hahellaceae bacterium]